ncbi:arylamine N-acetyltransferase family protein [Nocardioides cheoyonin]|uniref:arylamine N-acetyltransferase family protein n=1 Tax=Nocardioides cheoyonin TaxID=3156615 RepID=UPI0032B3A570
MTPDSWNVEALDLEGYLHRLGLPARTPGRAALEELHEAHVRTFAFDNVDVLLRRHPGVALEAVSAKFVGRGRGGYCFEHTSLFSAALERLGYAVRRHLGRVHRPGMTNGRTHFVAVVSVDGEKLLADPGFGMSLLRPVPLRDGATDDQGGWAYRVTRVDLGPGQAGWQLHRLREEGWELLHTTDELPVHPVDVAMGHHFTSTSPASHFTTGLMAARHLPGRHVTVTGETVTVRRPGEPTEHRPLRDGELLGFLGELGLGLTVEETDRLLETVARLTPAAPLRRS